MRLNNILHLIWFVALSHLAGVIGSVFTISAIPAWYATLVRPVIAPPNWIFAPVWLTLYTLMGIAAYLVWSKGFGKEKVRVALAVFSLQLVLNAFWSIIFFGMRALLPAFIWIVGLLAAILVTARLFHRIDYRAGWLMVPYVVWVAFATVLNLMFWVLNP